MAVPYASAATAWAPPTLKRRETPETWQAASVQPSTAPVACWPGVVTTTSPTPATRAGMAVISTEEG